ncbi:basic amino acid/polyamine antiporter [Oscillospiraceae bacterium MB08-C2-2]|nr:basic amino acid/polyamine antiporter [Oscillospiraceae bacterium MB08-C2-2]
MFNIIKRIDNNRKIYYYCDEVHSSHHPNIVDSKGVLENYKKGLLALDGNSHSKKLGLVGLIAVSMGTTIGSGVFTLAGDMAANGANTGAVIVGWLVCGVGMVGLILSIFGLNRSKPEIVGGISTYAQAGWGDFVGFSTTYGYWISVVLCNVSYATLLFGSIGHFIPAFGNGNNLLSIISASIFFWLLCALVCSGIRNASFVNVVVTIAKVIPIFVFMVSIILLSKFKAEIFMENFWGNGTIPFIDQVRATSTVTVWAFIGIEASVALSEKAKKMRDVGKAVVTAFFGVLFLYILISILSMGVLSQEQLAALPNPSMGGIMREIVGDWGASLISLGVIISLIGAALGITIVSSHIPNTAAKQGTFLSVFAKENQSGSPVNSALISTGIVQIFLVITYFSASTYQFFYGISASMIMIPYFLSCLYYVVVVFKKDGDFSSLSQGQMLVQKCIAVLGSIYGLWLIYSAGLSRLMMTTILFSISVFLYVKHQKDCKKDVFQHKYDYALMAVFVVGAIISIIKMLIK